MHVLLHRWLIRATMKRISAMYTLVPQHPLPPGFVKAEQSDIDGAESAQFLTECLEVCFTKFVQTLVVETEDFPRVIQSK